MRRYASCSPSSLNSPARNQPAAREVVDLRPVNPLSSVHGSAFTATVQKITSTRCARAWDKWGECAARMGLIYANLEDIAALLLSHKNDRKWDNDADLPPGWRTEFPGSCDCRISHRCFDTDTDSLEWSVQLRVWLRRRSPRETHMAKIKRNQRPPPPTPVNMSSAQRAGAALSKSGQMRGVDAPSCSFRADTEPPVPERGRSWSAEPDQREPGPFAGTVSGLHYTFRRAIMLGTQKATKKNAPKLPLFYCQLTQNIISNFLLLTQ